MKETAFMSDKFEIERWEKSFVGNKVCTMANYFQHRACIGGRGDNQWNTKNVNTISTTSLLVEPAIWIYL
jgi:hypothetical protein